ncbi:winged helix-turn-helix transcriptional regulator, partial [Burkholderia sp. Ap-962]|uniref:GntR family transcriptional regulator n=1 Tax=Burkholderia sp. Ap-962 TaxID=2608333 RepID=UPI00141F4660
MARTARSPAVPALGPLDRAAGQLSRQLAQALRDAIRRGGLLPGEPLPATRQLAAALGLARGTVIEAFEQLVAEGFLVSRGRTGTWVAPALSLPVAAMGLHPGEARPGRDAEPAARVGRAGAVGGVVGSAGTAGAAGIAGATGATGATGTAEATETAKSAKAGNSRRHAASATGENPAAPSRLPGPAAMYAAIAADFEPLPPIPFAVSVPGGATLPD